MKLYKKISVDLYDPYPLPKINVKQNDVGRGALVALTAGGSFLDPSGSTARVYARKPDGTKVYANCTIADKQIQIDLTNQMLAVAGVLQAELELVEDQDRLTTPIFVVEVLPTNIDEGAIESSNEYSVLLELISKSGTAISDATAAAKSANSAATKANNAAKSANSAATAANDGATAANSAADAANTAASSASTAAGRADTAANAAEKAAGMIDISDVTEIDLQAVWDSITIEDSTAVDESNPFETGEEVT